MEMIKFIGSIGLPFGTEERKERNATPVLPPRVNQIRDRWRHGESQAAPTLNTIAVSVLV